MCAGQLEQPIISASTICTQARLLISKKIKKVTIPYDLGKCRGGVFKQNTLPES